MIPFSPPRIDDETIAAVTEVLQSGWITTGPRTKLFEQRLAEYTSAQKVLCTASATAGLELMLHWWGVGPGDEVILPAYTYCASANVVEHRGATPVLVDCRSDYNLDPAAVAKKVNARTKVIMPVDVGGWPCDYKTLMAIPTQPDLHELFDPANERQAQLGRILVMSDSAHSIGASYWGHKLGSITDVAVFSFHAVKNLTTAEGGAIALNLPAGFDHDGIYDYLNTLSLHGQNKDARAKLTNKGAWRYDVIEAGFKCNMTDIQAAIGLVELERYEADTLPKRKAIFDAYSDFFAQHSWAEVPVYGSEEAQSSCHVYMLGIKDVSEEQRDQIIQAIFDQDVAVNVHFQPLPLLSHYRNRGYQMTDYPEAYRLYSREISLPVYYDLTMDQVAQVTRAVEQAVEKVMAAV